MKAVILPTGNTELLNPLTKWMPEYLLPVVNKPVVEHLIELLFRHDIKDIILVLKHMPYETEKYFDDGSKWGCRISYSLTREYTGPISSLRKIRSKLDDSFLCLPSNIVTNLDVSSFISSHQTSSADISITESTKRDFLIDKKDFNPFIITPKALTLLEKEPPHHNIDHIIKSLLENSLKLNRVSSSFDLKIIHDLNEYFQISKHILRGAIKGINIPGKEITPGVWVGRGVRVHRDAVITSPALIGDYAHIKRGVFIGKNSIIGNNVIVDDDASVKESIIFDSTYIGSHNEVKNSIIRKNSLTNLPSLLDLFIKDDLIIGDLDKKAVARYFERFLNTALALFLVLLFSPVMAFLFLYHLIQRSANYLASEERNGGYEVEDLHGNLKPRNFKFYFFSSKNSFIRRLPGLINVIKGDINLVGNPALSPDEALSLKEEWKIKIYNAPIGLFHLWEAVGCSDPEWEEKIFSGNFYSAKRSFKGDLKILLKTFILFK
jgi:mannose-1-phosphate guanylyltransferase / phosphomannomutase